MKEIDYIAATTIARLSAALDILRDVSDPCDLKLPGISSIIDARCLISDLLDKYHNTIDEDCE